MPPATPTPPLPPNMLCSDECLAHSFGDGGPYANNSYCQDGAEGDDRVTGNTCAYGTDCTDCGPRYYMPPSLTVGQRWRYYMPLPPPTPPTPTSPPQSQSLPAPPSSPEFFLPRSNTSLHGATMCGNDGCHPVYNLSKPTLVPASCRAHVIPQTSGEIVDHWGLGDGTFMYQITFEIPDWFEGQEIAVDLGSTTTGIQGTCSGALPGSQPYVEAGTLRFSLGPKTDGQHANQVACRMKGEYEDAMITYHCLVPYQPAPSQPAAAAADADPPRSLGIFFVNIGIGLCACFSLCMIMACLEVACTEETLDLETGYLRTHKLQTCAMKQTTKPIPGPSLRLQPTRTSGKDDDTEDGAELQPQEAKAVHEVSLATLRHQQAVSREHTTPPLYQADTMVVQGSALDNCPPYNAMHENSLATLRHEPAFLSACDATLPSQEAYLRHAPPRTSPPRQPAVRAPATAEAEQSQAAVAGVPGVPMELSCQVLIDGESKTVSKARRRWRACRACRWSCRA